MLRITGGRGVDRVYDPVGGEVFAQSLRCMAVESRICPIGFAGGTIPQIPANILLVKTIAVTGFNYGYYVGWSPHDARFEQADRTFALMERIRGWCEAGQCRPHVDRTFRLDEAAAALEAEEAAAAALRRRAPAVEVEREDGAHVEALVDVLALSHRVRGV